MKKRLAVTLAAVALSVVMSVPAYAGTWKYVNDQWKYQRGANKFAYKEWIEDNGNWYYMDNNGVMTTGWQQIDGQWYYMDQAVPDRVSIIENEEEEFSFGLPLKATISSDSQFLK